MYLGLCASSPSLRRSQEMCMSSVLVDVHHFASQTSRMICSRVTTLPASRSRIQSRDRKSTRLNSSHQIISYAVFCLKKKISQHDSGTHPQADDAPDENDHGPLLFVTLPDRALWRLVVAKHIYDLAHALHISSLVDPL